MTIAAEFAKSRYTLGVPISTLFTAGPHPQRMESLANAFSAEQMERDLEAEEAQQSTEV